MNVSPFRFFIVVGLHPMHNLVVLTAVTVAGVWTIAISPGEIDSALGLLLFVQMFLASTGFLVRARRGHFDPILTSVYERRSVLASHWLASIAPGLVAWAIVCSAVWAVGGGLYGSALYGRRMVAMVLVSTLAWTAGFPLARSAAGALWLAGLFAALLYKADLLGSAPIGIPALSSLTVLRHAGVAVVCPFLLLGTRVPFAPGSIAAGACMAALAMLSIWRFADLFDFYLRDHA